MSSIDPNSNNNENIDEYYDYLPADHPLMNDLQSALETQLKEEEEKLRLVQKEKSEELRKVKRSREDIGVNLYNYQQRYAKLETTFSEEYNKYMVLKSQLEETETRLNNHIKKYQDKANSIKEQQRMVIQATEELNQLNSMIKYIDQYNIEVSSQIEVTNRNAQVVEKKIGLNEKEKKKQDYLIDYLEEEIKNLHEKMLLFKEQLKSQSNQTKQARDNLAEAKEEIHNIIEKKKSILENWNKAVMSMKAKDKAMQAVMEDIQETESDKIKYTSQINKYKELIQKELFTYSEIEHEVKLVKMQQRTNDNANTNLQFTKDNQEQKRIFIIQSIRKTTEEINRQDGNEQNLRNQIDLIEKNKLKLLDMARTLNEQNNLVLSTKETHEKQTMNIIKLNDKLFKEKTNLQIEIDSKLNEVSRVEIDELNVETQNESIAKKIQLMNKEIENLEKDYKDHENRIKKNHEDLEKKQLQVDRLNKQFGHLTKNKGTDDEGFYEVKIKELQSDIINLTLLISTTEENWIKNKTVLVSKVNQLNVIKDKGTDMRSKMLILSHKKLRLNSSLLLHEKEIRDVEVSLKKLRYDMNKYNGLLSKNINSTGKLGLKFFDVEVEFREKLKQMENQSSRYEMEIESLREEKTDILTQILEIERQIHLWERKIKLQHKMQEIIKPESGKKEIDDITYTLHRQEILYKKLKQEQEQVILNIQMEIGRRDYIQLKFPSKSKNEKIGNTHKDLNSLQDDLNHIIKNKKSIERDLYLKIEDWNNIQNTLNEVNKNGESLDEQLIGFQKEKLMSLVKRNSISCRAVKLQSLSKLIEGYIAQPKLMPNDKLIKDYEKIANENVELTEILNHVKKIFDADLKEVIDTATDLRLSYKFDS